MTTDESPNAGSIRADQAGPAALLAEARDQRRAGRFAQAEAAYRQLLALRPNAAEARGELGNLLRRRGRLDEAASEYQLALALEPDLFEAHSGLAAILRARASTTRPSPYTSR